MIRIKDITLGQFAPRDSVLHKLDPRTKILGCFLLMGFMMLLRGLFSLVLGFVFCLLLYRLARLNMRIALKNIRSFLWLFLLTWILHAFFTPGRVLWQIPVVNAAVTAEGVYTGLFYTLRIILFILIANLMTLTTSPLSLTDAIERLLAPFKRVGVPAHEVAMMMSIALRFIPILLDEADRIYKAQISRGAVIEGNMLQKLRGMIPIILPLFLSAFRKANELALAMDARCYRGGEGRTSFYVLAYQRNDVIAFLATGGVCLIIVMHRMGLMTGLAG